MVIGRFIVPILIVTGAITALPTLQFFFPRPALKLLSGVAIEDDAALLFARHWGLVTATIGGLLIYAAESPPARFAIVLAVLVEKIGYAALVLARWNRLPAMRASGLFDAVCSAVYLGYIVGW